MHDFQARCGNDFYIYETFRYTASGPLNVERLHVRFKKYQPRSHPQREENRQVLQAQRWRHRQSRHCQKTVALW